MSYIGVYKKPGDSATTTVSGVTFSSSQPSSPVAGQLWYDTANQQLKVYNANELAWINVTQDSTYEQTINESNDATEIGRFEKSFQQIASVLEYYYEERFGYDLALSGDASVLAVGSKWLDVDGKEQQGAVYIFDWTGSEWQQRGTKLTHDSPSAYDELGFDVALSGDGNILVASAPGWDGTISGQGAVFTYEWNSSTQQWDQLGPILTLNDAAHTGFGRSVSLSDDANILVVGSVLWPNGDEQGSVFTYEWNSASQQWDQLGSMLTGSDSNPGDLFGYSTALSNDASILVVGSVSRSDTYTRQGGVYTYTWVSSTNSWSPSGSILNADTVDNDIQFGRGVALSSDAGVLAVTSNIETAIYDKNGTSWELRAVITDEASKGLALSDNGNILVIGAIRDNKLRGTQQGSVYTYNIQEEVSVLDQGYYIEDDSVIVKSNEIEKLRVTEDKVEIGKFIENFSEIGTPLISDDINDNFGSDIALSGDGRKLVVGAMLWDNNENDNQGGVFTYNWEGDSWSQVGSVLYDTSVGTGNRYGRSVALSGDGSILVVGVSTWDGSVGLDQGAVYTYIYGIAPPVHGINWGRN